MTLHRPLPGTISSFLRINGAKAVLLCILLSHRNFLLLSSFSSNVLKLRNRDNEPKHSRLKPVNEKDENQDQGTLACVAWRFWLGALSNKGGRGQRNREEIGAEAIFIFRSFSRASRANFAATPLLRPARQNRHATQAKGTLELDICYYRFIDGTSFVFVVVFLFLFSLRPSGSYALAFSFWHSLEDQLFSDPFAVLCNRFFELTATYHQLLSSTHKTRLWGV